MLALENGKINVDLEGERRGNELSGPCWTLLAKARTVKGGRALLGGSAAKTLLLVFHLAKVANGHRSSTDRRTWSG
jgi:hypothetical protein